MCIWTELMTSQVCITPVRTARAVCACSSFSSVERNRARAAAAQGGFTCSGNLPVSQSGASARPFVYCGHEGPRGRRDPARAAGLKWSETKSDPDQRGDGARGGGHSSIIPPREDRWRVLVEGLAPVYVAGTGSGGRLTGPVQTCPPGPTLRWRTGTRRDRIHGLQIYSGSGCARCSSTFCPFLPRCFFSFSGRRREALR